MNNTVFALKELIGQRVLFTKGLDYMFPYPDYPIYEGIIQEISPSGRYVNIYLPCEGESRWYEITDIKIIELLKTKKEK